MPKVTFLNDAGADGPKSIDVPAGTTILEAAKKLHAQVGYACGGVCACSTCHVYVERGVDSLGEISDKENDIMDKAWAVRPESRLACQAQVAAEDVVVTISPESLKAWLAEPPALRGAAKAA